MTSKALVPAPNINVTPLIDVLLVLLIIFMVAAPLKPHRFLAKLPAPPINRDLPAHIDTLVVTIEPDRTLKLNQSTDMGTVSDPSPLVLKLKEVFEARARNRAYRYDLALRTDLSDELRIEKTVFIKAPRHLPYGDVTRVLDSLKATGADPIGLQLDDLK